MPKTKTPTALTVQQATRQARRHVDALMPGVMATVDSNLTADPVTYASIVRTVVTFPHMHAAISELRAALHSLPGIRDIRTDSTRITITRTR
jgi:hypothetical protein